MNPQIKKFLFSILINGSLYGIVVYIMEVPLTRTRWWLQTLLFGIAMAVLQVYIMPRFTQKK